MIRVLKRKAEEKSLWQRPCLRIVESLEGFSFGDLEKVMSVIEQIDSKEGLGAFNAIQKRSTVRSIRKIPNLTPCAEPKPSRLMSILLGRF